MLYSFHFQTIEIKPTFSGWKVFSFQKAMFEVANCFSLFSEINENIFFQIDHKIWLTNKQLREARTHRSYNSRIAMINWSNFCRNCLILTVKIQFSIWFIFFFVWTLLNCWIFFWLFQYFLCIANSETTNTNKYDDHWISLNDILNTI